MARRYFLVAFMLLTIAVPFSCAQIFSLERRVRLNQQQQVRLHDAARHARLFNRSIKFPLQGSIKSVGIYTITVKIGTPFQESKVQLDTGSSDLWITCKPCGENCIRSSPNRTFDLAKSSTAIRCTDSSNCDFDLPYGDGSKSTGYYFQDVLYMGENQSSARIQMGCSIHQEGAMVMDHIQADGIFGLGPEPKSPFSQLTSKGLRPKIFSHCLREDGGGTLVFGKVLDPRMGYTPLLPSSQTHYNVELQRISVHGKTLQIDQSTFANTIIDSGTTLAYLPQVAFSPLLNEINDLVSNSTTPTPFEEYEYCYLVDNNGSTINAIFPKVKFYFGGNVSMLLKPKDYLINMGDFNDGAAVLWCLGIDKSSSLIPEYTILGDVFLREKIITYDSEQNMIGMMKFNCSLPINVSVPYNVSTDTSTAARHAQWTFNGLQLCIVSLLLLSFC